MRLRFLHQYFRSLNILSIESVIHEFSVKQIIGGTDNGAKYVPYNQIFDATSVVVLTITRLFELPRYQSARHGEFVILNAIQQCHVAYSLFMEIPCLRITSECFVSQHSSIKSSLTGKWKRLFYRNLHPRLRLCFQGKSVFCLFTYLLEFLPFNRVQYSWLTTNGQSFVWELHSFAARLVLRQRLLNVSFCSFASLSLVRNMF